MVVLIVASAVYGVAQLAALGWWARSVRWATVLAAVPVGMLASAPVAVAVQWGWTRAWSAATGTPVAAMVKVAGYTADPVIEELVKLGPLLLVWWLVPRVRRQWGYTDVLLVCAAVGSGFGLAEQLLRYSTRARPAFGNLGDGWTFPFGMTAIHVPGPGDLAGSWLPAGAQVQSFFASSPTDAINIHLVWSAVAGLGLALFLSPPPVTRRPVMTPARPRAPRHSRVLRWVGAGLVAFAAIDHAAHNTVAGGDLAQALAAPLTWLRHGVWAYPLAALAGAVILDRRVLATGRRLAPDIMLAGERTGPADGLLQTVRLAAAWPPRSTMVILGFTRLRRVYWTCLARSPLATPPPTAAASTAGPPSAGPPSAGPPPAGPAADPVGGALRSLAPILDAATAAGGPAVWTQARAGSAQARTRLRALASTGSTARRPVLRVALIMVWLAVITTPLVYLLLGSVPALTGVQKALTGPTGFRLMLAASALGAAWTVWTLTHGIRGLRAWRRGHPLAEIPARIGLATATRAGSLGVTAVSWVLLARGATATSPLISNYHVLDAIGQALLILGLALALTAVILDPPLALVVLAGGSTMLAPAALSAATLETLVIAGALGTTGIALMNTDSGFSGETSGSTRGGGDPAKSGDAGDFVPQDQGLVADRIAEHAGSRSIPGVPDEELPELLETVLRSPGARLRDTPSGSPRWGWWFGPRDGGTFIVREGNTGSFFQPDEGYAYYLRQLLE